MLTYGDLIFSGISLTKSEAVFSKSLREKLSELLGGKQQIQEQIVVIFFTSFIADYQIGQSDLSLPL